jgi:hypothetical protein
MKASDFKKIIKEAVREAIREELTLTQQTVQKEASAPPYKSTGNAMLDALNETRTSMTSEDYQNLGGGNFRAEMAQNFNRGMYKPQKGAFKPISDAPEAVEAAVAAAPKVGLDLSQLGFVHKAAAIVNEADRKQKEKYNV